jgi:hypothetical protein
VACFCLSSLAVSCRLFSQEKSSSTPKIVNPRDERVDERIRLGMAMLVTQHPTTAGNAKCSSVLVGDGILLTARHCVADRVGNTLQVKPTSLFGWVSPEGDQTEPMEVLEVRAHATKDLGIVRVKGMPKESYIFPLLKNRSLNKEDKFIVAGYGRVFVDGKEVAEPNRRLNWGWVSYKGLRDVENLQGFGRQVDNVLFEGVAGTWFNSSSAQGDSGGGIFLVENGEISLAGIVSFGGGRDPSMLAGAANVQGEEEWIGIGGSNSNSNSSSNPTEECSKNDGKGSIICELSERCLYKEGKCLPR